MKMIRNLMLLITTSTLFVACGEKASHHKTPGGMPYQVYEGKGGDSVLQGSFIKIHVTQKVNDSVYFTSNDKIPVYFQVTEARPYDISEVWTKVRVGDSIVAVQMMDTFIKRNPQDMPPHFKNGDKIYTYAKILDVFTSDSAKLADKLKEEQQFLANEIKSIEKYLDDKNLKWQKTPSGVYVEILNPGTGNLIDSGKYVSLNYTGTTFSGVKFDSNTDTSFHHTEPLSFTVGNKEMIGGFDEAMRYLRMGAKARIYIPSMLAYADRPNSPLIKPYEKLIFDLEVTNVQEKAPATQIMPPPPGQ